MTDKNLIFIILKSSYSSITNKQLNLKHTVENLNRHFSKEGIKMANRHIKRCSTLLINREMQIKTTMRDYFTLVRMTIIKKSTNNTCWWRCGEKGTHVHCWKVCQFEEPLWKTLRRFLKKVKIKLQYDPAILLLIFIQRNLDEFETIWTLIWNIYAPLCS